MPAQLATTLFSHYIEAKPIMFSAEEAIDARIFSPWRRKTQIYILSARDIALSRRQRLCWHFPSIAATPPRAKSWWYFGFGFNLLNAVIRVYALSEWWRHIDMLRWSRSAACAFRCRIINACRKLIPRPLFEFPWCFTPVGRWASMWSCALFHASCHYWMLFQHGAAMFRFSI